MFLGEVNIYKAELSWECQTLNLKCDVVCDSIYNLKLWHKKSFATVCGKYVCSL